MGPEKDVNQKQPEPAASSEKMIQPVESEEKGAGDATASIPAVAAAEATKETEKTAEVKEEGAVDAAATKTNGAGDGPEERGGGGRRAASNRANGRVSEGSGSGRPKRRKPKRENERHSQSEPESTDREGGGGGGRGGPRHYRRNPRDRSDPRPRVDMDESIPESHRYIWADDVSKRSLYIGNMSTQVTKEEVRALSDAIRGVRFVNRRSAFLDFESPEVASAQLEVLRTMQLKGQPVQIEPSRPRASSAFKSDRLVYVRGFPDDKGMEALGPLFPAALLIDRREGKVLLRFKDHESAISAINEVIAQDGTDYKFSFAAARPRWNRRGPPRVWRRPPGKFVKHETRQD